MESVIEKIEKMGIILPNTAKSFGSYIPAIQVDRWVYVSGQLPVEKGEVLYTGRMGETANMETGQQAARLCFINCLSAVQGLEIELDNIQKVVKLTGHICCTANFAHQPNVLNGASELSKEIFGDKGIHARAALGAYSLPMNALVELEAIFCLQ